MNDWALTVGRSAKPIIVGKTLENADRLDRQLSRFVLLKHELPPQADGNSHWDLMLETGDVLLTIQLSELPSGLVGEEMMAKRIADHRPHYLDYEGPISGNRGVVHRLAAGVYREIPFNAEEDHCVNPPDVSDKSQEAGIQKVVESTTDAGSRRIQLESGQLRASIEFSVVDIDQVCPLLVRQWDFQT